MIKSTLLRALGNGPKSKRHRGMRRQRTIERMEDRCVLASVSGTVIDDLDGVVDPEDPGMGGVTVFIDANANGALDVFGTAVEPDSFGVAGKIEQPGMTFSLADSNNTIMAGVDIIARAHPTASTGDLVFGTEQVTHFAFEEKLRVDFDTDVSSVTIDFIGSRPLPTDIGTLEIFSRDGTLLDSTDSIALIEGDYQSLRLERTEADIAFMTAFTKRENGITGRLDALRVNDAGSEISTLSASDGEYEIQNLSAGRQLVTQVTPDDFEQTVPVNGNPHDVTITEEQNILDLDFINTSTIPLSWHNAANPLDVDDDGAIIPFDVLLIVNELNEPQYRDPVTGELPQPPPRPVPAFFDVNDDGFVAPDDVLLIVNHLNGVVVNGAGEGEASVDAPSSQVAAAVQAETSPLAGTSMSGHNDVTDGSQSDAQPNNRLLAAVEVGEVEQVFDTDDHRASSLDASAVSEIDVNDAFALLLIHDLLS